MTTTTQKGDMAGLEARLDAAGFGTLCNHGHPSIPQHHARVQRQRPKPRHPLADEPGGDNIHERAYWGEL